MIKMGRKRYDGEYRFEGDKCIITGDNPFGINDEGLFDFDGEKIEGYVTKVQWTTNGREYSVIQLYY